MIIDGKALADIILSSLKKDVEKLSCTPTLAVIQIGDNPASLAYIKQKQKAAEIINANVIISNTMSDLERFNNDPSIHGVIIQRPVPVSIEKYHVRIQKDIDGFEKNTLYDVPVALAIHKILKQINADLSKHIIVVGRGETAGKPIFQYVQKLNCTTSQIFSTSPNNTEFLKKADIIISCVGKKRVITSRDIKQGVILISVGIWRDGEGKLHGDYDEKDIKEKASWYTPTPKGVGPVNVACLMQNLVKACMLTKGGIAL